MKNSTNGSFHKTCSSQQLCSTQNKQSRTNSPIHKNSLIKVTCKNSQIEAYIIKNIFQTLRAIIAKTMSEFLTRNW